MKALIPKWWFALAIAALAAMAVPARAQLTSITGLFTTGVNGSNVLLGSNVTDAHYVITAKPASAPANNLGSSKTITTVPGGWNANTTSARWVTTPGTPSSGGGTGGANANRVSGTFDYTLTFTMPAGAQLAWVSITGTGAAGDSATILVNGTVVSGQSIAGSGSTSSFTLDSTNAAFVSGSNTITFRVNNAVNNSTSGLFIGSLSGTAFVPEPAAYLPPAAAVAVYCVGVILRRRRQT